MFKTVFKTLLVASVLSAGVAMAADKPAPAKAPAKAPVPKQAPVAPAPKKAEVPAAVIPVTLPTETIKIVSVGRELATLNVELAMNPRDQERGLMGRTKMAKDTGMLFIFSDNRLSYFWMKMTLIPLDIVFIDQDGRIVKIHENAQPKDETVVSSDFPVHAALEIPAGKAAKYGLNLGDLVLSDTLDRIVRDNGMTE